MQDGASEDSSSGPCHGHGRDPQICFDFTKGLCTRGDKCKYSHDIATIVQFNSKEKGICFDYLRNQCHRGLLCRFSHDLSNIAQQCQVRTHAPGNLTAMHPFPACGWQDAATNVHAHRVRVVQA